MKVTARSDEYYRYNYDDNDNLIGEEVTVHKSYDVSFKLDKIVYCSDGYKTFNNVKNIQLNSSRIFDQNGEIPFIKGKNMQYSDLFLEKMG